MTDTELIDLYFQRNEMALVHTASKYGSYCGSVARNLLDRQEDAEECLNDVWLHSWRAIPPERPNSLKLWLGRLTRNLSIDRLRSLNAAKRQAVTLLLDELEECIPGGTGVEEALNARLTGETITEFLKNECDRTTRVLFLRRYWYGDSVAACAGHCGIPVGTAKSTLSRTRAKLKEKLEQEGIRV